MSVFYEGEHNDARTNLCIAFTAAMHGAAIANYAKVGSKFGCPVFPQRLLFFYTIFLWAAAI